MPSRTLLLALACAALCACSSARAEPQPSAAGSATSSAGPSRGEPTFLDLKVPKLTGRVVDLAKILTRAESRALTAKLAAHEKATRQQFTVLTITSLEGRSIEDVSYTIANSWKLGRAKEDDGLLIVVAPNDRSARIEVGLGLERAIPDALAQSIMQEQLVPSFRKRAWAAGLDAALHRLMAAARIAQ